MDMRGADLPQGLKMLRSAVPFVAVESVSRKDPVQPPHHSIAGHLRHDGSAGDVKRPAVPADDRNRLGRAAGRNPGPVHQNQGR